MRSVHRGKLDAAAARLGASLALALLAAAIDGLAHRNLVVHLVGEHMALVATGIMAALSARRIPRLQWVQRSTGHCPTPVALAGLGAILIWHIPAVFGLAVAHPAFHGFMHLSHVAAGFALGSSVPALKPLVQALVLIGADGLMSIVGLGMIAGAMRYGDYPPAQVASAGAAMIVTMQALWLLLPLGYWLANNDIGGSTRNVGRTLDQE